MTVDELDIVSTRGKNVRLNLLCLENEKSITNERNGREKKKKWEKTMKK